MQIAILYNRPTLAAHDPDAASESGVLESVAAFEAALRRAGQATSRVAAGDSLAELVEQLARPRPDVVVNLCEGFAGRPAAEPHVAAVLELLGLAYTGNTAECLSLTRDKVRTKRLLAGAGVPTTPCVALAAGDAIPVELLDEWLARGPLFIKPAAEDASLGIDADSVALDLPAARRKIEQVQQRYGPALVEPYIDGREFNVGLVALPALQCLPIAEINFQLDEQLRWPIVTYAAKWTGGSADFSQTPVVCPAAIDERLAARIESLAREAWQATGCRDYARVDLRMSTADELYVLEVNANPDAGPSAGLARAIGVAGIEYDEFVVRLVETAADRSASVAFRSAKGRSASSATAADPSLTLRAMMPADREPILEILRACEMFRTDEIDVAAEILDETIAARPGGDYVNLVAEREGRVVGWSCHGLIPLTDAAYDLYWIAVDPRVQARGIGRRLLTQVEELLRQQHARWLLAETSSLAAYGKTRAFYGACGYSVVEDLPDFYRAGDGKRTFGKRLG